MSSQKSTWRFWGEWTFATTVGWIMAWWISAAGVAITARIIDLFQPEQLEFPQNANLALWVGTFFGEVMGIVQWGVLKRYIPHAAWWIVVTNLAWTIALTVAVSQLGFERFTHEPQWYIGAIVGSLIGLTQWLFLRRYSPHRGEFFFWLLMTTLTGIILWIGWFWGMKMVVESGFTSIPMVLLGWALFGVIQGVLPGAALVFILRDYFD